MMIDSGVCEFEAFKNEDSVSKADENLIFMLDSRDLLKPSQVQPDLSNMHFQEARLFRIKLTFGSSILCWLIYS